MNRRDFLKRIAAAGLVAATPEILVPDRRVWALDRTMVETHRSPNTISFEEYTRKRDENFAAMIEDLRREALRIRIELDRALLHGTDLDRYSAALPVAELWIKYR